MLAVYRCWVVRAYLERIESRYSGNRRYQGSVACYTMMSSSVVVSASVLQHCT